MSHQRLTALFLSGITMVLLATGCGDDRERRLEAGVNFARRALERTASDPMAALALQSHLEMGGTPASYVVSCLPDVDPVFTRYESKRPTSPWTVVILEKPGTQRFTIEGYNEDLTRPRFSVEVGPGIKPKL